MLCLYIYWFCYENEKEKSCAGLFRKCKYRMKKTKIIKFIEAEIESESESESVLESDIELELNSELESDTE